MLRDQSVFWLVLWFREDQVIRMYVNAQWCLPAKRQQLRSSTSVVVGAALQQSRSSGTLAAALRTVVHEVWGSACAIFCE